MPLNVLLAVVSNGYTTISGVVIMLQPADDQSTEVTEGKEQKTRKEQKGETLGHL